MTCCIPVMTTLCLLFIADFTSSHFILILNIFYYFISSCGGVYEVLCATYYV